MCVGCSSHNTTCGLLICTILLYFHSKNFKWNHISGECVNNGLDYWTTGIVDYIIFALVFIISQVGTNSGMEHRTGLLRGVFKPGVGWPYWCTPGFSVCMSAPEDINN